jgi:signal transduction histidine kinase/DNA-binding response OmpR family regulator
MRTRHQLLSLFALAVVLSLAFIIIGGAQGTRASKAAALLSSAQAIRVEVLLEAAYVEDLIAARQRGDTVAEAEAVQLITTAMDRIDEMLNALREGARAGHLPRFRTEEERKDLAEIEELWTLCRGAIDALMAGRAVLRNREFAHRTTIGIAHRMNAFVGKGERLHERAVNGIHRPAWLMAFCLLIIGGAAAYILYSRFFRRLDNAINHMKLLSSGAVAHEFALPEMHKGDFGEFTQYLNRFLERLKESDTTKDRFLATMSHEIRTPMNGVIGFLGNLRETPLNEQQRQYVRIIDSSARSLLRVINEILDFSKISAGRLELEEVAFDVRQLVDERIYVASQLTHDKAVEVVLDFPEDQHLIVRGDPTRLRQVLDNLLNNAAKFTDTGEIRLQVQVEHHEEGAMNLTFTVRDTGIGIAPDQLRNLFKAFSQADSSTSRRYGGTGLGLCIADSLVRLMGGEISVQSAPHEGTAFTFTIPTSTARPEEQVQLSGHYRITLPPGALKKFWALLVDDTPTNLFLMETICQSIGLPYRTATNGLEAVEIARTQRFDLVFMDIQMPVMDGYTAIREIRKLDNSATTQIIALTASAFQEDVDRALGAGSTGFIPKPFERDQLLLCIADHLGIPVQRELRELPESRESREDELVRHMYDFMRDQYQISLGEIKMILAQSVADWRPVLDDLIVFSKKANWDAVRTIMHRLKGQLASTGLPRFAEVAGSVTAAVRSGETDALEETIREFVDDLGNVFRALEQDITLEQAHPSPR